MTTNPEQDGLAKTIAATFRDARREGMSIEGASVIVAEAIRQFVTETLGPPADDDDEHIRIKMQSIVSARTQEPAVQWAVGGASWQMTVDEARAHALAVLSCAEAAVQDAALLRWMTLGPIGADLQHAGLAIADLRRFRGDVDKENWTSRDETSDARQ